MLQLHMPSDGKPEACRRGCKESINSLTPNRPKIGIGELDGAELLRVVSEVVFGCGAAWIEDVFEVAQETASDSQEDAACHGNRYYTFV
jgi:hypothetical protein